MDTHNSVEATVSSIASKGMGGGAGAAIFGWFTSNEGMAFVGVSVTVLGFIVNLIFQLRRDRRELELQRAKLVAIKQGHEE